MLYCPIISSYIMIYSSLFDSCICQVLPNMASVADIKAVSYDVCGAVRMVNTGYKAKVSFFKKRKKN